MSQTREDGDRLHGQNAPTNATTLHRRVANPDDPPVRRPPMGPRGPRPGPNYLGIPGRAAIVQGQVFLLVIIVIAQLLIITVALFELLSGRSGILGWLTLVSAIGFVIALVISFWPLRRVEGS